MKGFIHRARRGCSILTWRHWLWATGIAGLVAVLVPLQYFDINSYWVPKRILYYSPWYVAFSYVFLLAIGWIESDSRRTDPGLWRYAAGAIVAGLACILMSAWFATSMKVAPRLEMEGRAIVRAAAVDATLRRRWFAVVSPGLDSAFYGLLGTLIYARLRNSRRMAAALTRAELARADANHILLASRLAAARARADPAYVIEQLEAIAFRYEEDPAEADAQLDRLIAFLREAIPRLRTDSEQPSAVATP